jgi:molecular chaperone GrpE
MSIADDLDLALAASHKSPEAVAEGLQMIHRRFRDILKENSVIAFESEGERFDPERHEAFDVVAAGGRESGIVHQEMRRGYFWNSKLLRPALVVVTK